MQKSIQTDEVSKLVKKVDVDIDDIRGKVLSINNSTSNLSNMFKENGLNNVSTNLLNIASSMDNIINMLKSYTDTLRKINLSYQKQEEEISSALQIVTKN